jgi:CelD/BcsL family acetyltransferase involved in cellulose biosynthesis
MAHWSVIKLQNGLGEHAAAWDALNRRKFRHHPMLDSRFVDGLLSHFSDGGECLCVLEEAGRPEAMCLLRPDKFSTWATFLPSQAQIGPALVSSPDILEQLTHDLPGLVSRLDILCSDSDLGDLTSEPKRTIYSTDHALTMSINLQGSFEDYWAARSKKLVQNVGRYERRLAMDGVSTEFRCYTRPSDITNAFARYAELESSGWKAAHGTAIASDNAQGAFYGELMARYAATGNAVVLELWLGARLAASRLVITSNDMVVMLKTTYSEDLSKYAPGRLLLRRAVEYLFSKYPGQVIEFYTNATVDQLSWATGQRVIRHVSFYSDSMTARLFSALRMGRNALASRFGTHEH